MKTDTTLPIIAEDGDCGDSKRVRVADSGYTVGGQDRPVKLPKIENNGDVGTSEGTHVLVDALMAEVAIKDKDGKTNAGHGVVSVMGRQRAMTTAVSTVVDEIPSYDIFGIFDGLRLAKFFEDRLRRLVKEEVKACHGRGVAADWNKVMKSCFSEAVGTVGTTTSAVVTIVGKEEVIVLCRGGARVVLYSHDGVALPLCHIHHHKDGVEQILKIHKRKKIDDFIVLACDGLWDVVSDDDTYQLVKRCLYGKLPPDGCISESSSTKAAVILAELAIARGSKENINVIVIDLKSSTVS
ncbi:putative protein phosphatase 2C 54 [Arabidopsis thaliana]|uniref:Probable protein phosphatase 2C 54 n=3 Tax=Arabidopsis TaxID=3701 RepID=P2C54_ARATH|nr:Protein phosphatase 2C family protein [Arabidopsis thaliana]Q9T010.1 RecName: Full=Probable protein phosphatase 2C 54; Short=AtPP2C54 [Arabidopsis thaliana]KAG7615552.1 PPM-type phosphatase domain superfamily [Arabidopsis thaliana x Arabidopsis arenosa]AAM91618.1 unknown protein [Arabidopsis thaliana]AEE82964.1 Protein phosphatase 2C family protein [Arabidopsis thaliana]OAO98203.1 hypothetical protein AXX17_AT4G12420 [Arabidopsis thaliana]CAB43039.1 putative protein [Arabidopsis thaliana]|eukprot:NP_192842.1 Protein phosphatase 2C family protein [Arabidopsis thaliana]